MERQQRVIGGLKALMVKSLWSTMGRRNLVRLARFLSNEARLDCPNDMSSNGELMVQDRVLGQAVSSERTVVFDVGANVGDWSAALLENAGGRGLEAVELHCFEPAPAAYEKLAQRIETARGKLDVELVKAAASGEDGEGTLHMVSDSAGINSLHARSDLAPVGSIRVKLHRLDTYCRERSIDHVSLVKCDAEGHDFAVLSGARGLLERSAIDVFQFEYNWRWVDSRHFLRDVFELIDGLPYELAKITPDAVEPYRAWDPELESYREANYVLVSERARGWFPRISWWNE